MLIFGLAIMLLLILVLVRTSLLDEWRAQLPTDVPNHFVMNVVPAEVAQVETRLNSLSDRVGELFPMIRGRITGVNEFDTKQWAARAADDAVVEDCLLYTSPSPRDRTRSRMPSSA